MSGWSRPEVRKVKIHQAERGGRGADRPRLPAWDVRKYYPLSLVSAGPDIDSGRITPNDPLVVSWGQTGHAGWTRYIPVSRFWPMQLVEGGWLLILSILLVAATVWLVRRRAA
jgi:hypothetical protein